MELDYLNDPRLYHVNQIPIHQAQNKYEEIPNTMQDEVQKENLYGSSNPIRQMMQLLNSVQPIQQIQQTAQNQLEKGFLDIKV